MKSSLEHHYIIIDNFSVSIRSHGLKTETVRSESGALTVQRAAHCVCDRMDRGIDQVRGGGEHVRVDTWQRSAAGAATRSSQSTDWFKTLYDGSLRLV